ncbi:MULTISPECIES: hypothetical protein [unclassified Agrococcus]|uniref:hypothetical protein n=1 Tax=unclassified Agrococcus TaxID=2615065 RepID=UPI003623D1DC
MIGWYVHHHGLGHLTRLLTVLPHVSAPVTVASSLPRPDALPDAVRWIRLERDDLDEGSGHPALADPTASGVLHWAPVGHAGHAARMATIAALLPHVDTMVVDVSVEVTALARLLGRRVVRFTQPGDRTDAPHALGDSLAHATIAPWPGTSDAARTHVGGISRFAERTRSAAPRPGTVLALGGGGRDDAWTATIERAIAQTPDRSWSVLGHDRWERDPWDALCAAEVVVTAAGQNAIADVAAVGARAVVLPRSRPFDEQVRTGDALRDRGLAVVVDDDAEPDWPALLDGARALEPDWSQWGVDGAAERAARIIDASGSRA